MMSPGVALDAPDALLALGVSNPVFDCKWPESRAIVEALWAAKPHHLTDTPYRGSQDGMETVFLDTWRRWASPIVTAQWDEFPWSYATMGSTEAIRDSLALHMIRSLQSTPARQPTIHTLDGEYEGYAAEFEGYGGTVIRHDRRDFARSFLASARAGDRVYLSQPSAIDGNVWDGFDAAIAAIAGCPGVSVAVDLTYVGLVAREFRISLNNLVIDMIFFSLSKVFGVYYHRIGGAFSRTSAGGALWQPLVQESRVAHDRDTVAGTLRAVRPSAELCAAAANARAPIGSAAWCALCSLGRRPPGERAGCRSRSALSILARGAGTGARLRACLTPSLDSAFASLPAA